MPLSVDGLILAASLTAFFASRNRLPVPVLARLMLGLGIGATVAVNWIFGMTHGILGGLLSAWPAASFIGAIELLIWLVRAAASTRPGARRTAVTERRSASNGLRQWARDQGYNIADRGRLPDGITEAYELAHSNGNGNGPNS